MITGAPPAASIARRYGGKARRVYSRSYEQGSGIAILTLTVPSCFKEFSTIPIFACYFAVMVASAWLMLPKSQIVTAALIPDVIMAQVGPVCKQLPHS